MNSDKDNDENKDSLYDNISFSSKEAAETEEEVINIIREMTAKSLQKEQEEAKKQHVYEDKKVKMEETKSSAWSLIIVGVFGIVFILLYFCGFIPVQLSTFTKYITVSYIESSISLINNTMSSIYLVLLLVLRSIAIILLLICL